MHAGMEDDCTEADSSYSLAGPCKRPRVMPGMYPMRPWAHAHLQNSHELAVWAERDTFAEVFGTPQVLAFAIGQRPDCGPDLELSNDKNTGSIWAPQHPFHPCWAFVNFACPVWLVNGPYLYDATAIEATENIGRIAGPLNVVNSVQA